MRPEPERERALHPRRASLGGAVVLPVRAQRRHRLLAELQVVVRIPEAVAPPRDLEELHEMLERPALALVEALQDLVQQDPEALVDGRLLRDAEDARELVFQRADPVRLD